MAENPVLLFDGVCNFCNRMVNFAIRNDRQGKIKFTPLQSEVGQKLKDRYQIPASADTVILIDKGKAFTYASAAIRVSRYLDWPAKMLYAFIIVPRFISQPTYKWMFTFSLSAGCCIYYLEYISKVTFTCNLTTADTANHRGKQCRSVPAVVYIFTFEMASS